MWTLINDPTALTLYWSHRYQFFLSQYCHYNLFFLYINMFLLVLISLVKSPPHLCVNTLGEKQNYSNQGFKTWSVFLSPICKLQMEKVMSQAYECDCELVSMSKNEHFIVYFYHVTKIFFDKHFQCDKIFSNSISIFCPISKIFEYSTMSFV